MGLGGVQAAERLSQGQEHRPVLKKRDSARAQPDGTLSSSTEKFAAKHASGRLAIGSNRNLVAAAEAEAASRLSGTGVKMSSVAAGGFDDPRSQDYSKESPENDRKSRVKAGKPWDA